MSPQASKSFLILSSPVPTVVVMVDGECTEEVVGAFVGSALM